MPYVLSVWHSQLKQKEIYQNSPLKVNSYTGKSLNLYLLPITPNILLIINIKLERHQQWQNNSHQKLKSYPLPSATKYLFTQMRNLSLCIYSEGEGILWTVK